MLRTSSGTAPRWVCPRISWHGKAGITYSTLTKLESGVNQNPKVKSLQQVAKALGVTLNDLMKE